MFVSIAPYRQEYGKVMIPFAEFQSALHFAQGLAGTLSECVVTLTDEKSNRIYATFHCWGMT